MAKKNGWENQRLKFVELVAAGCLFETKKSKCKATSLENVNADNLMNPNDVKSTSNSNMWPILNKKKYGTDLFLDQK